MCSAVVGTVSARWFRVLMTPSLCSSGWWESNSKYWSVCVGFLYTSMLRLLSSSVWTVQYNKGRPSPLTSSCVNLMLLSTAFICSAKASTSLALILTPVSSRCLNLKPWLPVKVIKALPSTSSMTCLVSIGDTSEPMKQLCFWLSKPSLHFK